MTQYLVYVVAVADVTVVVGVGGVADVRGVLHGDTILHTTLKTNLTQNSSKPLSVKLQICEMLIYLIFKKIHSLDNEKENFILAKIGKSFLRLN